VDLPKTFTGRLARAPEVPVASSGTALGEEHSVQAAVVVAVLLLRLDLAVSAVPSAVPARGERHQRKGHEKTRDGGTRDS
jgi:hypothetical protein